VTLVRCYYMITTATASTLQKSSHHTVRAHLSDQQQPAPYGLHVRAVDVLVCATAAGDVPEGGDRVRGLRAVAEDLGLCTGSNGTGEKGSDRRHKTVIATAVTVHTKDALDNKAVKKKVRNWWKI
jgi:hypothetical protein